MAALSWNEALALQQPDMDHTHREFVALLGDVEAAVERTPAELGEHYALFLIHTEAHFAQEERWMAALGFAAENCHSGQHAHVLQVLREVQRRLVEDGDVSTVALLVQELAHWFPVHARNMDAALVDVMVERGFDPATGEAAWPLGVEEHAFGA